MTSRKRFGFQFMRDRLHSHYQPKQVRKGLCEECWEPVVEGKAFCAKHLAELDAEFKRAMQYAKTINGMLKASEAKQ